MHLRLSLIFLLGTLLGYGIFLNLAWHRSEPLELDVSAFQSRNWLYGNHYLYRVQLNSEKSCRLEDKFVCLHPVSYGAKPFTKNCLYQMRGDCHGDNHFVTHARRFYIPSGHEKAGRFFHQRGKITLFVSKLGPVFVKHFSLGQAHA